MTIAPPNTSTNSTTNMIGCRDANTSRPGLRTVVVQEEHRRVGDQAHGDVQPAAHAPGVALHHTTARLVEREPIEQLPGASACVACAHVEQATDELQVLEPRGSFVHRGALTGQTDAGARTTGIGNDGRHVVDTDERL